MLILLIRLLSLRLLPLPLPLPLTHEPHPYFLPLLWLLLPLLRKPLLSPPLLLYPLLKEDSNHLNINPPLKDPTPPPTLPLYLTLTIFPFSSPLKTKPSNLALQMTKTIHPLPLTLCWLSLLMLLPVKDPSFYKECHLLLLYEYQLILLECSRT